MSITVEFNLETAKQKAKALQERYAALNIDIKLGQAYEAVASMAGYKSWHVMKDVLENAVIREVDKRDTYSAVSVDVDKMVNWAKAAGFGDMSRETIVSLMDEFYPPKSDHEARMYEDFFCDWMFDQKATGRFDERPAPVVIDKDAVFERWQEMASDKGVSDDPATMEAIFNAAISTPGHLSDEALDGFYEEWLEQNAAAAPQF